MSPSVHHRFTRRRRTTRGCPVAPPLLRGRALVRQRLTGLLFLAVLTALVAASVGLYQKAFTPVVTVTLEADPGPAPTRNGSPSTPALARKNPT